MKSYQGIGFIAFVPIWLFILVWGAIDLHIPRLSAIFGTLLIGSINGFIVGYFIRVRHEEQAAVRQAKWAAWVDEVCPPLPPRGRQDGSRGKAG